MTIPFERTHSLLQTKQFLEATLDPKRPLHERLRPQRCWQATEIGAKW